MKATRHTRLRIVFFVLLSVTAGIGTYLGVKSEDRNVWILLSSASTAIISIFGLVTTIKEDFPGPPGNIGQVLDRASTILEHEPGHHRLITLLCEYPAWGALSERETPAFQKYEDALFQCVAPNAQTRVVLVAPDERGGFGCLDRYSLKIIEALRGLSCQ